MDSKEHQQFDLKLAERPSGQAGATLPAGAAAVMAAMQMRTG